MSKLNKQQKLNNQARLVDQSDERSE